MFNLTTEEKRVVLFVVGLALLGTGISFFFRSPGRQKAKNHFYEQSAKIDLNTADHNLLLSVRGIGKKLAARILDYRSKNARFTALEELKNIKGITENRYQKLKEYFLIH